MKKHFGLMSGTLAVVLVSAAAFAQPPTPPAPPAPAAPSVAVTAPVAAPAPPAAPAAPSRLASPQKPPAPPKPAAAPKTPPEPPEPPEPTLAPGRERIDPDPVNIRFEVTITYQSGTSAPVKRTAVLTVANNTGEYFSRGSLRSGNNVPVPTTTFTPAMLAPAAPKSEEPREAPPARPVTSFQYRSVGLNVDVQRAAIVAGNRVRATLNVEFSGVDEKASSAPAPSFPTFSQGIGLYLDNGKPVLVAQSSDVVDNVERKQTVEVKATILR